MMRRLTALLLTLLTLLSLTACGGQSSDPPAEGPDAPDAGEGEPVEVLPPEPEYEPLVEWGGAGATVPLTGFGHNLAKGVREAVASDGWLGVFTGGLTAAAGGIAAAVVAGVLAAALFRPGDKR